jgi:hypothetical protein
MLFQMVVSIIFGGIQKGVPQVLISYDNKKINQGQAKYAQSSEKTQEKVLKQACGSRTY